MGKIKEQERLRRDGYVAPGLSGGALLASVTRPLYYGSAEEFFEVTITTTGLSGEQRRAWNQKRRQYVQRNSDRRKSTRA